MYAVFINPYYHTDTNSLSQRLIISIIFLVQVRDVSVLAGFGLARDLWQVLWGVALVWLDDLAAGKLGIGIARVDDLLVSNDRESLKALSSAKLARPSAANSEGTALDVLIRSPRSWVAVDGILARCGSLSIIGVDAEAVVAGLSIGSACALEVLHCPGGTSRHHRLRSNWLRSWCSGRSGGSSQDSENGGELHICC